MILVGKGSLKDSWFSLSQQEEEVESRLWNKYRLGQRDITSDSASDSSSDLCLPEPEGEQEEEEEEDDTVMLHQTQNPP